MVALENKIEGLPKASSDDLKWSCLYQSDGSIYRWTFPSRATTLAMLPVKNMKMFDKLNYFYLRSCEGFPYPQVHKHCLSVVINLSNVK